MRVHPYRLAGEPVEIKVAENGDDLREFRTWWTGHANAGTLLGFDTETTGLAWTDRIRLAQFGDEHTAWVIPVELGGPFREAAREALATLPNLVAHNLAFDALKVDTELGIRLEDLYPRARDSRIAAHLLDSRHDYEGGVGLSLKPLSAWYVDPAAPDTQGDLTKVFNGLGLTKQTGWAGIDLSHHVYELYAGLDALLVARLLPKLLARYKAEGLRSALLPYEHSVALVCAKMQRRGMLIDPEYTEGLVRRLGHEKERFSAVAARFGVSSVNSSDQVAGALLGMGERLTERTDSGALSVAKDVLLPLADLDPDWVRLGMREPNALADAVLRAKRAGKWSSSYAEAMLNNRDEHGRIHPKINPLGAQTGRASHSDPAMAQLPSHGWEVRRAVVAERGSVYFSVDQQAVELRVLAALSGESRMVEAIAAGKDLHGFAAELMFGPDFTKPQRGLAKIAGLGTAYQGGAATLAKQTGQDVEVMRDTLRRYSRAFPGIKRWARKMQRQALAERCTMTTAVGRRLHLDRDKLYKSVAYACQSTARDTMGQALLTMDAQGLTPYLTMWVHDEVVGTAPKHEAAEVAQAVAEAMKMTLKGVPLDTKAEVYGPSWADGYKLPKEWAYAA
ncbi:DNA polymerase [Kitasatospora sp. NBC_01302]|uniref:DNA polymerase n=1 Tax=Kitasatospora sp. NBC_01302 TaxID=2903575 RepID=UPI002E0F23CF|nr:DNA polymerase [Kitasatospora sp. NBC_01302]